MKPSQLLLLLPLALLALPCEAVALDEALAASLKDAAFGPEASSNFSLAAIELGTDQKDKLGRDIVDLEDLVTGLTAEGATPELKPLLEEVEALLNSTLDQVIVAWNATWEIMNKSNASFEDCWFRQVYLGDMDEYARAHYYCRLEEASAFTAYDEACTNARDVAQNMWEQCNEFHGVYNPVSDLVPAICEPDPVDETNELRATRLASWFSKRSQEWHESYTVCETKFNESLAANETCYKATDDWEWHQNRCDLLQQKMDWVGCNYYRRNNCSEHERCWISAEEHWGYLNITVYKNMNMHWVEWAGLRRIRCLIRAIGMDDSVREGAIEECRLGAKTGISYDMIEVLQSIEDHMVFRWETAPPGGDPEAPTILGADPSTWSPDADFVIIKPLYCKTPYPGCPAYPLDPPCQDLPDSPAIADVKPGTITEDRTEWLDAYLTPKSFLPTCSQDADCPWPVKAPWAPCKSVCCTMCFFYEDCRHRPHVLDSHDVEVFPGIFSDLADKTCCQTADWEVSEWSDRCSTGCGNAETTITRTVKCIGQQGQELDFGACSDARLERTPQPESTYVCNATEPCPNCTEPCPVGQFMTCPDGAQSGKCSWCTLVAGHFFIFGHHDGGTTDTCKTQKCDIEECGLGQFLDKCEGYASSGSCRFCAIPENHYVTDRGLYKPRSCPTKPCEPCPAGAYREGCGLSGPGVCKSCPVVAGKYFTGPGSNDNPTSCPTAECPIDCPLGQHRVGCEGASPGQCEICSLPAHTYAIDFGRQHDSCSSTLCEPDKCSPGKYLKDCGGISPGVCEPCDIPDPGYWYKKHGLYDPTFSSHSSLNCTGIKCVNCTAGYYRKGCGGNATPAHGGNCSKCTVPARGYFHITHGGVTDSCEAKSCSADDMKCPKGSYRWNCGGHLKGACVTCDAPPEGRYQTADGGLTKTCPDAECDPSKCAVGFYLRSCGGRQHPTKNGTCVPCTAPREEFYQTSHGGQANKCVYEDCKKLPACPNGQYRKGCGGHDHPTSTGECVPCTNREDGFYFIHHGGLTPDSCQKRSCRTLAPCAAGYHRKDCGTENAPTSTGSCAPCSEPPFGKFSSNAEGACSFESCTDKAVNSVYPCGAGQYLLGCGCGASTPGGPCDNTKSSGTCTACLNPSANMYFSGHGGIKNACPESSCEAPDLVCGIGQYRKDCGGGANPASSGVCAPCDSPALGNYLTGPGTVLNDKSSCAQSSCLDVANCKAGEYSKDCGAAANPGHAGLCTKCKTSITPGFYYVNETSFVLDDNCTIASCADLPSCETGNYRAGCGVAAEEGDIDGAMSPGECKPCNAPAANNYISGHGGLQPVCPQTSCNLAPNCEIGEYRSGCGVNPATGMGSCLPCADLQKDQYYYTHGGLSDACSQDSCANVGDCGIGQYRAKCGAPHHPASKGECNPCTNLPLGMRWTTSGGLTDSCKYEPVVPRYSL